MSRIIAFSNNKGGVGKTTTVVNLAGVLVNDGYKVLIIDTDSQSNSALSFGINPDKFELSIYDVLTGKKEAREVVYPIMKNLDMIPANDKVSFFEIEILRNLEKYPSIFNLLRDGLKDIDKEYDFVLVDTPPSLGLMQGNVLTYVERVIIPYHPEAYSMRSLVKMIDEIRAFHHKMNDKLDVLGVLTTKYKKRTKLHRTVEKKTRSYCEKIGVNMFNTIIHDSISYPDYLGTKGIPITFSKKTNGHVSAYYKLKEEILNVYS